MLSQQPTTSKLMTTERHRIVNTRLLPTPEMMLPTSMKGVAAAARGLGCDASRAPGMYVYIYINIITTNEFIIDTTTHYNVHHQLHINKLMTTEWHCVVNTQLLPTPETTLPISMKRAAAARGLGCDVYQAPGMYVYIYINIITTNEFIIDCL